MILYVWYPISIIVFDLVADVLLGRLLFLLKS
jgi:hypothetical protein